jgi:hypothetical protein
LRLRRDEDAFLISRIREPQDMLHIILNAWSNVKPSIALASLAALPAIRPACTRNPGYLLQIINA